MLIGATLEPGKEAKASEILKMQSLNGEAPEWIQKGSITHQWIGVRAQPANQPAPILEKLEPGLIIATGHYRNGILLAPATAEWIGSSITNEQR